MGPAAVAVLIILCAAAAEARVPAGHLATRRRDSVPAGVGACALAVAPFGYPCEEHTVTTVDGYILSLQRIPRGRRASGGGGAGQPVLLQHGVLTDGMTWLLSSPEESLAYILADSGFDVWVANNRGTRWSSRHVSLDSSSRRYWDWSWDDLVVNDMPSLVDYIYSHTEQKPHFLGHSMGTLVALAAFSEGRTVDKLKSAALLTPVAYLSHMTTPLGILLAKAFVGELITILGVAEFNPVTPAVASLFKELCRHPGTNCYDLLTDFTGKNYCLNSSAVDVFLQYEPQPTSTKTMVHLAQTFRDGVLSKYDYVWPGVNVEKYGQPDPPAYNMSNIPAGFPLFLSYGGRDELADPGDVGRLLGDLRGHDPGRLTVQYLEQFAHADFVIGTCAKDYVYNHVVSFFNRFN
ncbi:triacylglycerol lipase 2 [Aegilops tauschii subsp. strangulata]|uniref:Lipase n=4 Tax=Aegilops tauschii subsp. strangulata TaxID=200361 RepID=A0A453RMG1_AEGTS|nr:triacylglycerol lipase 2 [Aegilops tauschii subsp. strangulata]